MLARSAAAAAATAECQLLFDLATIFWFGGEFTTYSSIHRAIMPLGQLSAVIHHFDIRKIVSPRPSRDIMVNKYSYL